MAKHHSFLAVLVLTSLWTIYQVDSKEGFIATLPQTLRQNTQTELCMTMYSSDKTETKEASFKFVHVDTRNTAVDITESYTSGVQKCTAFEVPDKGSYELLLTNETDSLHEAVEVQVRGDDPLTLVQTDKPQYKPGQTVKFRILTMLHTLKPRTDTIASVYVSDPNDIRVKQFLDVETQGLASLEFQLVDRAKLGEWTIHVTLEKGGQATTTTFKVEEYVLPRFEVTITPPAYILLTDDIVTGQVCASYTYGKPVTGFLDLSLFWRSRSRRTINQIVEINGCYNFSANLTELRQEAQGGRPQYIGSYYPFFGPMQIKAAVTEAGTGVVVNKTESGPAIGYEALKIALEDYTNDMFKPGLPYYGKVTVTKPDGSPAGNELISVTATTTPVRSVYNKNFTTDSSGVAIFALCDGFTKDSTNINLEAVAVNHIQPDTYRPGQRSLYTPQANKRIRQWFSPSLSYIQIPKIDTVEECNNRLTLSVPFTTVADRDTTFTYQIFARNNVVKTGQVQFSHSAPGFPGSAPATPPEEHCLKLTEPPTVAPPTVPPPPGEDEEGPPAPPGGNFFAVGPPGTEEDIMPPPVIDVDEEFREPIVRSEVLSDTLANVLLDFTISSEMSPEFTLVVFHVRPDGEVVADSMKFTVQPCFDNEVELQFNTSKALPGDNVELKLSADPGSVCGVGVVDKSVNILGGDHQITPEMVFKRISQLSQTHFRPYPWVYYSDSEYCEQRIRKLQGENLGEEMYYMTYNSPYVDAFQAFKTSGLRVFTNLDLETRPCERTHRFEYDDIGFEDGEMGPEAPIRPVISVRTNEEDSTNKARVRSNFPETWIWALQVVGDEGQVVTQEKAPDTVTSWVGNAVCMAPEVGFGVSKLTTLTTFQPFFVSLQLPYSAVRGERLPVILTIFNYLQDCLNVELSLTVDEEDFEVHQVGGRTQKVCLCGETSESIKFYITPKNVGSLDLLAKAAVVEGSCKSDTLDTNLDYKGYSDGVKRQMLVRAEGVKQEYSNSFYICHEEDDSSSEDVILPLPSNVVDDSAVGDVKVIGDIMGAAMANLDNLVRMPTGCGEQNMVGFVPNICVLDYLTSTGRLTEEIKAKATKHMEIGYQRELTYRHGDGSYSAFGERDEAGSVWLTAFVVKSFAQAKPYIFIDEKELELSTRFLRRSQLETGCFRETGKVFSSYMMGGLSKSKKKSPFTSLTAYVLVALLQAGTDKTDKVIVDGLRCMNRDFNNEKGKLDPYALSLAAYVNVLYDPESRATARVMRTLNARVKRDGVFRFWGRDTAKPPAVNTWYYHAAPSAEVEMTSYALLALLTLHGEQAVKHTHDIAMWLSQQRNPHGGFSSTQDTVMGLQALATFAKESYNPDGSDMMVSVSGQGVDAEFTVSDGLENTLLLQSAPIKTLPNKLTINTEGYGCVLVQSSVTYNKPADKIQGKGRPPFYLKVSPRLYHQDIDRCDRSTLKFTVRLKNRKFTSGMSLLEVRMVTGWRPTEDSLLKLKSRFPVLGIKEHEFKEDAGIVTFYFDQMSRKPKEFTLDVEQDREMAVSNPKPAEVTMYQYYETDVKVVKPYNIRRTCGTKAEIPHARREEFLEPNQIMQVRVDFSRDRASGQPAPPAADAISGCPVCTSSKKLPPNLDKLVCQSQSIYKSIAGRKGKMPLKLMKDMRPKRRSKSVNSFAKFVKGSECECEQLNPPSKRVVVFVTKPVARRTVTLDKDAVVLPSTRKLDKEIRKLVRSCET